MATYAVIEYGKTVNTILADSKEIAEEVTGKLCVELSDGFGVGDTWDGEKFIKQEIVPPAIEG